MSRRIQVVQGTVVEADLQKGTITLADNTVFYGDHLLFALGSTTNFRNVEGAERHCLTMKTLHDALRLQTLAERRVELAASETDAERRSLLLSFAVAGGGYTGVETAAALNDLVHDSAKRHAIRKEEIKVTIIEPEHRLMAEMPDSLAQYAQKQLESDGIHVTMGESVQRVEANEIFLVSGKTIRAGTMVWDTGIVPNPLIAKLRCPKGRKGGFATDSTFRVKETGGVWAIGDCAEVPKADGSGTNFAPTAQNATRQGTAVAKNIIAAVHNRPLQPFRYKQIGELAVISRYRGVANVFGIRVHGFAAWLMWRGVYLIKMPSMRARFGILNDWIRLLFGRRFVSTAQRLKGAPEEA